jgi:Zn-finger nucleic acid-binding protein
MPCPECDAELTDLAHDDEHVFSCQECGALWSDGSQLNAWLLHHSLPGLDSVGGKSDPDAQTGTCPSCKVGLTRVEQSGLRDALMFDTCEDCGFVLIIDDGAAPENLAAAQAALVSFFKRFSAKHAGAKR